MAEVGAGGSFLAAQDERIGMRKGRPADGLFLLDNRAGRGATRNGNRLTEAFPIGLGPPDVDQHALGRPFEIGDIERHQLRPAAWPRQSR